MPVVNAVQRIFDFVSAERSAKRRIALLAALCFLALC